MDILEFCVRMFRTTPTIALLGSVVADNGLLLDWVLTGDIECRFGLDVVRDVLRTHVVIEVFDRRPALFQRDAEGDQAIHPI